MVNLKTKLGGLALGLMVVFAAVAPASAQQRNRWRNRDLSTGAKVGIIGGGAAAGAVIGGLLNGKTGAILGGVIGGGAGTGYVLIKDRNDNDGRYYGRYRNNEYRGFENRGGFINRGSFINRSSFRDSDYDYRGNEFRTGGRNRDCDDRGFRGSSRRR